MRLADRRALSLAELEPSCDQGMRDHFLRLRHKDPEAFGRAILGCVLDRPRLPARRHPGSGGPRGSPTMRGARYCRSAGDAAPGRVAGPAAHTGLRAGHQGRPLLAGSPIDGTGGCQRDLPGARHPQHASRPWDERGDRRFDELRSDQRLCSTGRKARSNGGGNKQPDPRPVRAARGIFQAASGGSATGRVAQGSYFGLRRLRSCSWATQNHPRPGLRESSRLAQADQSLDVGRLGISRRRYVPAWPQDPGWQHALVPAGVDSMTARGDVSPGFGTSGPPFLVLPRGRIIVVKHLAGTLADVEQRSLRAATSGQRLGASVFVCRLWGANWDRPDS